MMLGKVIVYPDGKIRIGTMDTISMSSRVSGKKINSVCHRLDYCRKLNNKTPYNFVKKLKKFQAIDMMGNWRKCNLCPYNEHRPDYLPNVTCILLNRLTEEILDIECPRPEFWSVDLNDLLSGRESPDILKEIDYLDSVLPSEDDIFGLDAQARYSARYWGKLINSENVREYSDNPKMGFCGRQQHISTEIPVIQKKLFEFDEITGVTVGGGHNE